VAEHILKNTSATLRITFSAGDADAGVTITVTRADGTAIATNAATTDSGVGVYTYVLPVQSELDSLTAVWTGAWSGITQSITTYAEIVGGTLFTLADLRAFGDKALVSPTTYPDTDLRAARDRITDLFERVCRASFIPRFYRETLDASGNLRMWLSKKRVTRLISVTVDGTAQDLSLISVYNTGRIERDAWFSSSNRRSVVVAYEYGWPSPPPDIQRAAMTLARYELVTNDISDRMIAFENDLGSVRLSVPGRNFPTGIPIVDATLARYDETEPVGMLV
jgi:hypothetical protein